MNKDELKGFVNNIFRKAGHPPVTNFAKEFSDGIKFQLLFNLMYDEKINCQLSTSNDPKSRMINWSKINSLICFTYLQQKFYLVEKTMAQLSAGNKTDPIFKLIKVMIQVQQQEYQEAHEDTSAIEDIAEKVETDKPLFSAEEAANELPEDADDYTEFKKEFMSKRGRKAGAGQRATDFMYLLEDEEGDLEQQYANSMKREQRCRDSSPKRKQQMKDSYAQYVADLQDAGMNVSEARREILDICTEVEQNPYVIRHSKQATKYYGKKV